MTEHIILEAPLEDREAISDLQRVHGDVEIIGENYFDGAQEVIQIIVPLTTAIIPSLVAFLRGKFGRTVKKDGEKIHLTGYTADEAEQILRSLS